MLNHLLLDAYLDRFEQLIFTLSTYVLHKVTLEMQSKYLLLRESRFNHFLQN